MRLGEGVAIGRRVKITGPSVIGDGVRIGDGAVLQHSIVWDGVTLGDRVRITNSIIGIGYDVPADTSLVDRVVANEPIAT